jgi:pimeloyl-ACP methyl ester carboxylesterase
MPVSAGIYYFLSQGDPPDGLPVVLLHGAGGMHLSWPSEVRRLPGQRVYALDLPGHGKSRESGGQQTIAGYARLVLHWLDSLKLHRAVFVGHSMGSAVALALALHHAERVLGIGLLGSGVRLRVHPDLLAAASSPTSFHKAVEALVSASFSAKTAPHLVELVKKRIVDTRQSVLYGDLLACNAFDVSQQITQVGRPALVMTGIDDRLTPIRYAQYLADAIPGARRCLVPDAGHMLMLEQPQAVAGAMEAWLKTIPFIPGEVV